MLCFLKVMLQFAVQRGSHGSESPRLSVEVFSLKADVCKRTFDLSVTASTGRAVIVDHFVQGTVAKETAEAVNVGTKCDVTWRATSLRPSAQ